MPTTNPFDDENDDHHHQPHPSEQSYDENDNDHNNNKNNDDYDDDDYDNSEDDYDSYDDEHYQIDGHDKVSSSNKGSNHNQPVEASWQFLGDLPYRKITLYDNIQWGVKPNVDNENIRINDNKMGQLISTVRDDNDNGIEDRHYGLACLPSHRMSINQNTHLNSAEYEQYIRSTTQTIITSCPFGGPIATVTVPFTTSTSYSKSMSKASIRIMTNSGQLLSTIDFPPLPTSNITESTSLASNTSSNQELSKGVKMRQSWFMKQRNNNKKHVLYSPSDIFTIGFTGRCILVVILRDSLCLTYTLSGKPVLDPFYIFHHNNLSTSSGSGAGGSSNSSTTSADKQSQKKATTIEVIDACIYDGGVAVLCSNMTTAIVELLDSNDRSDAFYRESSHVAARVVKSVDFEDGARSTVGTSTSESKDGENTPMDDDHNTTSLYALITPLSTSTHAQSNYISYTSIAVLSRIHTHSRHPEVFLGTSNNSVIVCDSSANGSIVDMYCQERIKSPILKMKFAPNGRFLACFTKQCVMTVISTNFETKVLDFDTSDGSQDIPHNMEWCGEDSVVLHWKNVGVLMVGPYGDWLRFLYEDIEHLHLSAEMDCCRVITDSSVEILQRVPPTTAAMLRIGSIEAAAMLLDASDAFENGSPASDEAARAITKTGMLEEAIETCTNAALREFDVSMQKRLLKAASYGMHFEYKDGTNPRGIMGGRVTLLPNGQEIVHPSPLAVNFVENAKKLRVINALRDPSVGVAITVAQYDAIEATGVIARLIAMKRPALATSLSNYLQLDESVKVYARASRASAFVIIDAGHTDAETAETAIKILNAGVKSPLMNRGAYATVALAAYKAGRQGVSNLLLTLETSVSEKVPALTAIGLHSDAAAVAAESK